MDIAAQFGDNLARVRRGADMAQDELSVRASVHRTEISQLERGLRVARIDTLAKLCATFGSRLKDRWHRHPSPRVPPQLRHASTGAGVNDADLAEIAGHRVETMLSRYTHPMKGSDGQARSLIG